MELRGAAGLIAVVGAGLALIAVTPAALALSGNAGSGNAAAAQYSPFAGSSHGHHGHRGQGRSGASGSTGSGPTGPSSSPPVSVASGSSLPFTGYALLAALGIGVCLLSAGTALRRRADA